MPPGLAQSPASPEHGGNPISYGNARRGKRPESGIERGIEASSCDLRPWSVRERRWRQPRTRRLLWRARARANPPQRRGLRRSARARANSPQRRGSIEAQGRPPALGRLRPTPRGFLPKSLPTTPNRDEKLLLSTRGMNPKQLLSHRGNESLSPRSHLS